MISFKTEFGLSVFCGDAFTLTIRPVGYDNPEPDRSHELLVSTVLGEFPYMRGTYAEAWAARKAVQGALASGVRAVVYPAGIGVVPRGFRWDHVRDMLDGYEVGLSRAWVKEDHEILGPLYKSVKEAVQRIDEGDRSFELFQKIGPLL